MAFKNLSDTITDIRPILASKYGVTVGDVTFVAVSDSTLEVSAAYPLVQSQADFKILLGNGNAIRIPVGLLKDVASNTYAPNQQNGIVSQVWTGDTATEAFKTGVLNALRSANMIPVSPIEIDVGSRFNGANGNIARCQIEDYSTAAQCAIKQVRVIKIGTGAIEIRSVL